MTLPVATPGTISEVKPAFSHLDKQAYVDAISVLFDGAIQATPEQISEEVMIKVDIMISEIVNCSEKIKNFAYSTFYTFTLSHFSMYGSKYLLGKYVVPEMSLLHSLFIQSGAMFADYFVNKIFTAWVEALTKNRAFAGCLNVARANWRSPIEADLMGL